MKFKLLTENIKNLIKLPNKIVSKNVSLPILENLLLKTEKGGLKIIATDLELTIKLWIPGKIQEEGEITVPADHFVDIITNLKDDQISFEQEKFDLEVNTDSYEGTLKGKDSEDFPVIPEVEEENKVTLSSDEIADAIRKVKDYVVVSEARPEVSGIYFDFKGGDLSLVGTDTYRLGKKEISSLEVEKEKNLDDGLIVPLKAAQELIRVIDTYGSEEFDLVFDENQVLFDFDEIRLVSSLIEGEYPDYKSIVPEEFETEFEVSRKEFIDRVNLVSFSSSDLSEVTLNLQSDSKLKLSSESSKVGTSSTSFDVDSDGKEIESVFNYRYLLNGLNNIEDDNIIFKFSGPETAAYIQGTNSEDYYYILMPIKSE